MILRFKSEILQVIFFKGAFIPEFFYQFQHIKINIFRIGSINVNNSIFWNMIKRFPDAGFV
jgi:hypothetical protein